MPRSPRRRARSRVRGCRSAAGRSRPRSGGPRAAASSDMAPYLKAWLPDPIVDCRLSTYDRRPMVELTQYVIAYGLPLIFGFVLLEQLGAPIPALPVLIVAGALAVDAGPLGLQVLAVAVVASLHRGLASGTASGGLQGQPDPEDALPDLAVARLLRAPDRVDLRSGGGCPRCSSRSSSRASRRWRRRMAGAMRRAASTAFLLYDARRAPCCGRGPASPAGMRLPPGDRRVLAFLASLGSGALILLGGGTRALRRVQVVAAAPLLQGAPDGADHASRSCAA